MINVLFVCFGNLCRSPMAQGVFGKLVEEQGLSGRIVARSAGTHTYFVNDPPDPRAQEVAGDRGIDLSGIRARRVAPRDLENADYVVAMDQENYDQLRSLLPSGQLAKLWLLSEFAPGLGVHDIPDPYYGAINGFERVMALVDEAAKGLLTHIRTTHGI